MGRRWGARGGETATTRRLSVVILVAVVVGFLATGAGSSPGPVRAAEAPAPPEYLNQDSTSTAPYSDAVRVGDMLYLAGNLGLDADGNIVPGGITRETRQALENLKGTLERNGSSMDRVVSCLVFLADIRDRDAMNEVYQQYWEPQRFPARTTIGTSGLYGGARIEISCTAVMK